MQSVKRDGLQNVIPIGSAKPWVRPGLRFGFRGDLGPLGAGVRGIAPKGENDY